MQLILFDDPAIRPDLLPFTFTRPVAECRLGILLIREKWERHLQKAASWLTQPYLQELYPICPAADQLFVNGAVCPSEDLVQQIAALEQGQALVHEETVIAWRSATQYATPTDLVQIALQSVRIACAQPPVVLRHLWEFFLLNAAQIRADFLLLTAGRRSQPIADPHTVTYKPENIFVEEGAIIRAAILNAEDGPIYIGKNVRIGEGSIIRGATAFCEGAELNLGAKIRGETTIGPWCKVGGEVSKSILFGHSNKAHDGYIGNTVIGEWCNLGADTNTSNLKNNYSEVKIWSYAHGELRGTGQQFCGLMMADHTRCGINTMFNTGTVVGPGSNLFGGGFPPKHVPPFSWGGSEGLALHRLPDLLQTEERVMARRGFSLAPAHTRMLSHLFEQMTSGATSATC